MADPERVTPPPPTIRVARRDELPLLAAIERGAAERFTEAQLPGPLRKRTVAPALLEAACEAAGVWVAVAPHGVVGFLVASVEDGFVHLHEMSVLPAHGRRGVGSALLAALHAWVRARGSPTITLTTFEHVPWNAPYYRRHGFESVPPEACPPHLQQHLAAERAAGLQYRVAMRHPGAVRPASA